ncbi:hypothetical protein [Lacihabitans soyangensis]|uniref:hypothetical protein n=1 Tax=Lacihabitans soyangensis TaxID=869394 RepID=UPI0020CEA94A|nr:hypothetical protein [Lacihabitans soyangensis]
MKKFIDSHKQRILLSKISASRNGNNFQELDFGRLPDVSVEIRNKRSIVEIDFPFFR